jgi:hypothetical protein
MADTAPPAVTPPEWSLAVTAAGRVHLLWSDGSEPRDLELGAEDEVSDKLAGWLAERDYGERS